MKTSSRLPPPAGEPCHAERPLRAGPLALRLRGTRLLAVHAHGHEVWHGVAFLYRDEGWGTPEPVADRVTHTPKDGGFELSIEAHIPARERIELRIEIEGKPDGTVRYEAVATPTASLDANRIGLCLLHSQDLMGRPLEVTHVDGRTSRSSFPTLVPAWPPFTLVQGLRHEYADGAWASCQFEGDAFEFEDQRNNADASFKTYSRSNFMPRPLRLPAGVAIRQRLVLRLDSLPAQPATEVPARLSFTDAIRPMPPLGIGITPDDARGALATLEALRELTPARLHLRLPSPSQPVDWPGIVRLLAAAGAKLRLDIEGLDDAQALASLGPLARAMDLAGVSAAAVAVFPGSAPQVAAARQAFPSAAIGGGTPFFFAQINRIEQLGPIDFLSFTTSSIVHGADDESVMQGLRGLPWLLRTLQARYPDIPVQVGPSAIAAPRSPLGPQPASDGKRCIPLARLDPRTGTAFGAAWALGHVAALAGAGAQAVSVLALTGDQGLLRAQSDGSLRRSPAFDVLRALCGASRFRSVESSHPGEVAGLAIEREGQWHLLAANLTQRELDVSASAASLPSIRLPAWGLFQAPIATPRPDTPQTGPGQIPAG